jgi:hypothetical protein
VGTGNHWVIDAIVGWMVILVAWVLAAAVGRIPLHKLWSRSPREQTSGPTSGEPPSREGAGVVE